MPGSTDAINALSDDELRAELHYCCPSARWIDAVIERRPYDSTATLLQRADEAFAQLTDADWLATFAAAADPDLHDADEGTRNAALVALRLYQERFGYPFVTSAEQLAGEELLMRVRIRLGLEPLAQLRASRAEQRKLAHARLRRLLERTTA